MNNNNEELMYIRNKGRRDAYPFSIKVAKAVQDLNGFLHVAWYLLEWFLAASLISAVIGLVIYFIPTTSKVITILLVSVANALIFGRIWTMYARKEKKRKAAAEASKRKPQVERSEPRPHPTNYATIEGRRRK